MSFDLESYMESRSLPEEARSLLREQMKHVVSVYTLDGQHLENPYGQNPFSSVKTAVK